MTLNAVQSFISDARRIRQSIRTGEILIVDDELSVTEFLTALCKAIGEKSVAFRTLEGARWYIKEKVHSIKLAILDYMLTDGCSDELIELCQQHMVPCIIHTGRADLVNQLTSKYPGITVVLKSSPVERLLKEIL